ncbi:FGGY carbohydrate kinase domain-containing protein-like [Planococcus citri]|uniref:FGGY carbohydrate kinase domain-containing protein-like n=1 Tax=Planococcus citri TaxID=170843 RepID=UPI0031FA4303
MNYVIGIDVGTGSVRGALFTEKGKLEKLATQRITTWNPKEQFYQQSSDEIWSACCTVIKQLIIGISIENIKGLGFDATASVVVIDTEGNSLSVNVGDENTQNVILWMDHRAEKEARIINTTEHPLLNNSGGKISVESMIPKLLWLKNNHSKCWESSGYFFLLPDFLTWKATGQDSRSLCCVIGKCNYQCSPELSQWNYEFFESIGLGELRNENWKKIGSQIITPGKLCGKLTSKAAKDTGLLPGTPVGASLIDAHAGGIGMLGCSSEDVSSDFTTRVGSLAMICGTSTCHMTQTKEDIYVGGLWGPYYSAMVPNMWLLAGGQSVSGKLIDHIIDMHPASSLIKIKCQNLNVAEYLDCLLNRITTERGLNNVDELTNNLHVWPDFHGNRSPLADSSIRGMIHGLTLNVDEENLALLYLATIQALVYSTKFIIDTMKKAGHHTMESIFICGGLSKNKLFVKTHANAIGLKVLVPEQEESVLLGAAELGATAAGIYPNLQQAMLNMAGAAKVEMPNLNVNKYHEKKYEVFLKMLKHQIRCKLIMES